MKVGNFNSHASQVDARRATLTCHLGNHLMVTRKVYHLRSSASSMNEGSPPLREHSSHGAQ